MVRRIVQSIMLSSGSDSLGQRFAISAIAVVSIEEVFLFDIDNIPHHGNSTMWDANRADSDIRGVDPKAP